MINHTDKVPSIPIKNDQVKDVLMSVLVSKEDGWTDHVMREFELGVTGYTPKHAHPWFHVNYVLEGEGELLLDGEYHPLTKGSVAFVDKNKTHQFRNTGNTPFKFICIVPNKGHTL